MPITWAMSSTLEIEKPAAYFIWSKAGSKKNPWLFLLPGSWSETSTQKHHAPCWELWALFYGELLGFLKQETIRVRSVHIRKIALVEQWEWTKGEILTIQDPETNSETYKRLDTCDKGRQADLKRKGQSWHLKGRISNNSWRRRYRGRDWQRRRSDSISLGFWLG